MMLLRLRFFSLGTFYGVALALYGGFQVLLQIPQWSPAKSGVHRMAPIR